MTVLLAVLSTYSGVLVLDGRYQEALTVVEHMMASAQEDDSGGSRLTWKRGLAHRAILLAQLGSYEDALQALEHYMRVESPQRS